MININEYIKEGIVFSLNYIECDHLIKGPSLFKEVTKEAQDFYLNEAAKENAIIGQFADEINGIKKPFEHYFEEDKKSALTQKIYVVINKNTTLYEFWQEMQKYTYELQGIKLQIRPMFLWYKGIKIDYDVLDDIE